MTDKPRVFIRISDGEILSITSDVDLEVMVFDHDLYDVHADASEVFYTQKVDYAGIENVNREIERAQESA